MCITRLIHRAPIMIIQTRSISAKRSRCLARHRQICLALRPNFTLRLSLLHADAAQLSLSRSKLENYAATLWSTFMQRATHNTAAAMVHYYLTHDTRSIGFAAQRRKKNRLVCRVCAGRLFNFSMKQFSDATIDRCTTNFAWAWHFISKMRADINARGKNVWYTKCARIIYATSVART